MLSPAEAEPYGLLAQGFDALAPVYDDMVEGNPLHRRLRARSLRWLEAAFPAGSRVLEIGCGTGIEALWLAQRGVEVVATDVSPRMVAAARDRFRRAGLTDRLVAVACPAAALPARFGGTRFDGAYASLDALNCEPDPEAVLGGIAGLLRPGAPFLLSVVSRPCLWEIATGLLGLRWGKAFRRLRRTTEIDLYGVARLPVRPFSEVTLRRLLEPRFHVERVEGLLVFLPPPYLSDRWERLGGLQRPLERLEDRLRSIWPFRGLGDHLHVWATRREA